MTWIRHESVVSRARGHAYTRPRRKCIVMDAAHDTLPLDLRLSRFINRENSKSRQNANDKYPVILSTISFFLSFFLSKGIRVFKKSLLWNPFSDCSKGKEK